MGQYDLKHELNKGNYNIANYLEPLSSGNHCLPQQVSTLHDL